MEKMNLRASDPGYHVKEKERGGRDSRTPSEKLDLAKERKKKKRDRGACREA